MSSTDRFYKGLPPLWMRQIPYTMMKFAAFERTVEFLYKHMVPVPRDHLGKPSQLVVTFAAGYIAGVLCTLVSHPADSIVSKLNSQEGSSIVEATRQLGMSGKLVSAKYEAFWMSSYTVTPHEDIGHSLKGHP